MLHRVFLDDSADGTRQKYVIAAGLIGKQKTWNNFGPGWKKILHAPPRINWFHSKEWRSLTGEFAQFRDAVKWPKPTGSEAADAKRGKLKEVIQRSKLVAVGIGVLIPDFNLVRNADPRAADFFRPDPFEGALQGLVYECAKAVRLAAKEDGLGDDGHCIGYVSDDSNKAPIYSAVYSDFKSKNPEIGSIMRGLAHLDDKKWPGLQAADMVAHITNQVFRKLVAIPPDDRTLLQSLPELQGRFFKIANMDKWYMCHVLNDLAGVDLFKKLGIDRRKYKSDEELDAARQSGKPEIRTIRQI